MSEFDKVCFLPFDLHDNCEGSGETAQFDFLLNVHSNQLRSCRSIQFPLPLFTWEGLT